MSDERNWYRVEMMSGQDTYCFFGSCQLDEALLTQALGKGEWILIEDLVYFDEYDRAQGWAEWDPNYLARIHLNPQFVVSIMPMLEDPRKETYGTNDILTLPTGQSPHQDGDGDENEEENGKEKKKTTPKRGASKGKTKQKPRKKKSAGKSSPKK